MQVIPSEMSALEQSFKEYTKKVFESDEQLSKAEANWKRHKREIKDIFWENEITNRQLAILKQDNWHLFNAPRKYFLRKKFFQLKADLYAHLRSGPDDGKSYKKNEKLLKYLSLFSVRRVGGCIRFTNSTT